MNQEMLDAFAIEPVVDAADILRGDSIEARSVQALFAGRKWTSVRAESLLAYDRHGDLSAVVAFLSPQGFRYYLPALISFVVGQGDRAGPLLDSLLAKLASDAEGFRPEFYSQAQRTVVSSFLSYLKKTHTNDKPLARTVATAERLWNKT